MHVLDSKQMFQDPGPSGHDFSYNLVILTLFKGGTILTFSSMIVWVSFQNSKI